MIEESIYAVDIESFEQENLTYYPPIAERGRDYIGLNYFTSEGILICGTDIGRVMTTNKFKGLSVQCVMKSLLEGWLELTFKDGSSNVKLEAITNIESRNIK